MNRVFVVSILMTLFMAPYVTAQTDNNHMAEQGMIGQDMGQAMQRYTYEANRKFLDDTADLRKELHNKKFEYYEALRNADILPEKVMALEREIWDLQRKIFDTWQKQLY